MLRCFGALIEEIIEAYVDDIEVKSKKIDQLMADLKKTIMKLRENVIKLNPKKCIFRVCWEFLMLIEKSASVRILM
jgi:hypothetical protein